MSKANDSHKLTAIQASMKILADTSDSVQYLIMNRFDNFHDDEKGLNVAGLVDTALGMALDRFHDELDQSRIQNAIPGQRDN